MPGRQAGASHMDNLSSGRSSPAFRIVGITVGTLAVLLVVVAVVRPDMMTMHAMRQLFVGFGL